MNQDYDPCSIPLPPSPTLTETSHHSNPTYDVDLTYVNNPLSIMTTTAEHSELGSSIRVLETHNYHQWSDLMLSYFIEHNLYGIVDGTEAQPTSSPAKSLGWLLRQKKAAGFIARKLDANNRDLFINDVTRRNPQALWEAIKLEYASKKARNRSRLFTRFLSLNCLDGDLAKYCSSFREILREMSNAGVKLDDDLLAHMVLHQLPSEHQTTRQVIIATAESSDIALTVNGVLSQITELIRDGHSNKTTSTALNTRPKHQHSSTSSYERCMNGNHNSKAPHSAENCWQLHPSKNPHLKNRTGTSNSATIVGRALCTKAVNGNHSGKPILDTGTTQAMFKDRKHFVNYGNQATEIEVANGDSIYGTGVGAVRAVHRGSPLTFCNALHVPSLKSDLVSMTELAKKGCSIVFQEGGNFEVVQDQDVVMSGKLVDGLMELDIDLGKFSSTTNYALATRADGNLLHSRVGHPGPIPFSKIYPQATPPKMCDPCIMAKHHQLPYGGKFKVAKEKLEILHSDLSGLISPTSLGGHRYYFKITDSSTSYKFVYLPRHKSETLDQFMKFKTLIETQTSFKIKTIVNDNGGEYTSKAFKEFLEKNGVQMMLTAPYTPQKNPVSEIGNRTTVEKARALLKHAGLPSEYWAEAVSTAVYLENRTPIASRKFVTPYELWHGRAPTYHHLRVFGCLAYVHVGKERRNGKFADTAKRGVFLGYQEGHHNYSVMLLEDKRVVYSHDVLFNEEVFPLRDESASLPFESSDYDHLDATDPLHNLDTTLDQPMDVTQTASSNASPVDGDQVHSPETNASALERNQGADPHGNPSSEVADSIVPVGIVEGSPEDLLPDLASFRPTPNREIKSNIDPANILPHRTRRSAQPENLIMKALLTTTADPKTYHQAMKRPDSELWIDAMKRELDALERMGVWEEVELPEGKHALGTTWVYKRKTGASGELIKHKARLCAQGFSQIEGIDYSETYAPTGRLTTLRTCLSISAQEDFEVIQMDAIGAFLNGVPDETLYISPPKGYICKTKGTNIVLKLNKSLYGLKQLPRCWYNQLKDFFSSINFSPSNADPCFFFSKDPGWKCGVYVHVDDLCIMGQNTQQFKDLINARFDMEDLGECTYFLGMRITRDRVNRTITLYQDKYVESMLIEYGMEECRPISTPMIPNTHLVPATEEEKADFVKTGENYRRAVGLLNYLVLCTRPDLALVASQLAQFLENPGILHWAAFKRVLRYLRHSSQSGLTLGGGDMVLEAYSDSDYAGCPYTRRSVTGYVMLMGKGCVSWRARKQATVATSSTEAEYRAAYKATQEIVWIRLLLSDFGYPQQQPTSLKCDNQGALALSKNPLYHSRSKHFDIVFHWIRERVDDSTIAPSYVPTALMLADFLTKALHQPKFTFCIKGIQVQQHAQRGGC